MIQPAHPDTTTDRDATGGIVQSVREAVASSRNTHRSKGRDSASTIDRLADEMESSAKAQRDLEHNQFKTDVRDATRSKGRNFSSTIDRLADEMESSAKAHAKAQKDLEHNQFKTDVRDAIEANLIHAIKDFVGDPDGATAMSPDNVNRFTHLVEKGLGYVRYAQFKGAVGSRGGVGFGSTNGRSSSDRLLRL